MSSMRVVRKDSRGLYIQHEGMRWYADAPKTEIRHMEQWLLGTRIEVEFSGIGIAGSGFATLVAEPNGVMWISEGDP